MEKAIDFCFRTGGTAGSVVTTQIATGVAFMAPSAIRCDRLVEREMSNFPEVLPYFHHTYPVLSSSITSGLHSVHSHYEPYTNTQLAALDIIDESDLEEREARGKKVDEIVKLYRSMRHLSGERNHKRACKILRLYCQGLTEDEISDKLKISQPTVHLHLARAIERLKAIAKRLYNRRASLKRSKRHLREQHVAAIFEIFNPSHGGRFDRAATPRC